MRSTTVIHVVSCHAEGEVGDVIVGGVAPPPGETLWEQSRFIARDETLRNFLLNEPRGGVFRHVNLLVPTKRPGAFAGFIVMEPEDTPPMSGSNAICVANVLLDSDIAPMQEPQTRLTPEAPGGLIEVVADCRRGKAERISVQNVPSFADRLDAPLEVKGFGALNADIAYGGDSFVIVDAASLGFAIRPDEARDLAEAGMRITAAANEQLGFVHPDNAEWSHISFCQFAGPLGRGGRRRHRPQRGGGAARQDRPLADRHRLLGADGDAAREGPHEGRRPLSRALDHRVRVRLPDRRRSDDRRPTGDRPRRVRPRVDHRNASAHGRSRRPLAGRLSAQRHVAAMEIEGSPTGSAPLARKRPALILRWVSVDWRAGPADRSPVPDIDQCRVRSKR